MPYDNEQYQHREWLGLLQPKGLVVSPPALVDKQAFVDKQAALRLQPLLQGLVKTELLQGQETVYVPEFAVFAEQILEWKTEDYIAESDLPTTMEVNLSDYGEVLRPRFAVEDPDSEGYLLLVQTVPLGHDLDQDDPASQGWKASYQEKFERLLKGVNVPIGVLWNGVVLRLVYGPSGESSGHLTFPIEAMTEVPGRLILGALEMLLGEQRLFNAPTDRTLPKLLEASRAYQANVSTKLAEQVLDALWELLRGFQAAEVNRDDRQEGAGQLQALAADCPQHVYGGLLTTLMRLVFLLYAEDQGLMPDDEVYQGNYSVSGLYENLREDTSCYPDTMDQRHGAWAWLLSLFRLVYDGGGSYEAYLPARHGQLFDPAEYPFLEGNYSIRNVRNPTTQVMQSPPELGDLGGECKESDTTPADIPRVADGVIYRMLQKLLILDGERLSYRALDVEQIGSVYEAIMGYEVEIAQGRSIAVRPKDVVINLEMLLATKPKDRSKVLKDEGELKLTGKAATALKKAETIEDILAALERRVSKRTQQELMPGSLYLQPGEERRRTGSHYTPRKLTQPIVETTLRPIFERLGDHPTADQILELKVCDLAMGSAAFLVEACRQLAQKLVDAWDTHGMPEDVPETVEPLLYARRLVAQRCLYGVDKNPFAVNLAKLSLWLVTLAKDAPFTFVDHSLKCGDSLVGLTRAEIGAFGKDPTLDLPLMQLLKEKLDRARSLRSEIQGLDTRTDADAEQKLTQWQEAEQQLADARLTADIQVAAFFAETNKKKRQARESECAEVVRAWRRGDEGALASMIYTSQSLRTGEKAVMPLSWEIEFPEVFDRENPGFDAIVGNPPFAGKNTIINGHPEGYLDWLKVVNPESHGNADLVAHFFRRAFRIIRVGGTAGLIATNTIAQGDTRNTGLRFICQNGGVIYNATRRYRWPGLAAVVVSVVHLMKVQ